MIAPLSRPLAAILEHFPDARRNGANWEAKCPAHEDSDPSLSITQGEDGRVLLHCFAGCSQEAVVAAIGRTMADLFPEACPSRRRNGDGGSELPSHGPGTTYEYHDEEGRVLFRVVRGPLRDGKKTFGQNPPDGKGGWIKGPGAMDGVRRVLFRLPELVGADPDRPIYIVEGEKDALNLAAIGLIATTNPGGAGKWGKCEQQGDGRFSEALRGRRVVILPDNDSSGRTHAVDLARRLFGLAASVKVLTLPRLPDKGDVSDWLSAGGTRAELERMVEQVPEWTPPAARADGSEAQADPLPREINVGPSRPVLEVWEEAALALAQANHPPTFFVRSGMLVRVRIDEKRRPTVDVVDEARLRGRLARIANFVKYVKKAETYEVRHVCPPRETVQDVLSCGHWPGLPALEAVVEAPTLRPDGTILDREGYDSETHLLYIPAPGLRVPPIPERPTRDHALAALHLVSEAICDFPFVDDASKAAALALILTMILRPAIRGPVPMALVDSPQQGTGKSKLASVGAVIATGREADMTTVPGTPEEWRKKLTSLLVEGRVLIVLDNVETRLSSEHLASVLTATTFQDRDLGRMKMTPILPQNAVWCATGNNITLGGDLGRRCYLCRLDARMAEPWRRPGSAFQHPDLIDWVTRHRGDLIAAILTMGRAWFVAGCPVFETEEIGFPAWSRVIGGVLGFVEVHGFLDNADELYAAADTDSGEWETFLTAWCQRFPDPVRVSDIADAAASDTEMRDALPGDLLEAFSKDPKGTFAKRLGWALRKRIDRRYGARGLHVSQPRDGAGKVKLWAVRAHDPSGSEDRREGVLGVSGVISPVPHTEKVEEEQRDVGECDEQNPQNPQNPLLDWSGGSPTNDDDVGF
jgi:hypothetical protein